MANVPYSTLNGVQRMMVGMPDGSHAERVVAVNEDGSPIGGGAGGTPVLDASGVNWLWSYDIESGTSTYVSYATGLTGTPTFPVTPNADTSVSVSNFPPIQPVSLEPAAYTPSIIRASVSGSVAAGANSAGFYTASGVVTVNGAALNVGESVSFTAPINGVLTAIAYTVSNGEIVITEVR